MGFVFFFLVKCFDLISCVKYTTSWAGHSGSSVIPATQEALVRGSWSEASLNKNSRPYLKSKLKAKRNGGLGSSDECKHEVFSSITSTIKKTYICVDKKMHVCVCVCVCNLPSLTLT
jgi:biotin synthase-related radical SAM superfamily protein